MIKDQTGSGFFHNLINLGQTIGSIVTLQFDAFRTKEKSEQLSISYLYLALTGAVSLFGLWVVNQSYNVARVGGVAPDRLFWVGIWLLFGVVLARVMIKRVHRDERILLLLIVGVTLYLVKVLHSPLYFTFSDEFSHWRSLLDLHRFQDIFIYNPVLPIASYYPALPLLTNALTLYTGLSNYSAGILLLLITRVTWILAMYCLFQWASRSARVASVASLFYIANPNFLFFNGQFAYESLSLPLLFLALAIIVRWTRTPHRGRWGFTILFALVSMAVVSTHHLTGYALLALVAGWWVIALVVNRKAANYRGFVLFVLIVALANGIWINLIGGRTSGYLLPQFARALEEVLNLITRESTSRELFRSGEFVSPEWERWVGILSTLLLLGGIPIAAYQILRYHRRNSLLVFLSLASFSYPVSIVLRFTYAGAETAVRSSEFIYVLMALPLTMVLLGLIDWATFPARRWRYGFFAIPGGVLALMIMFSGGIVLGWAPWARLPGTYLPAADTRSIEPMGIRAAQWMQGATGADNRIATDRINRQLMGTYGLQTPITSYAEGIQTYAIFFATPFSFREQSIVTEGRLSYLIVDSRLTLNLPAAGVYYERGEPNTWRQEEPFNRNALFKFEQIPATNRLFDNGPMQIYDLRGLRPNAG